MLANASLILAFFIASSLPIAATLIITALILSFIYSPLPLFLAASEIFWKVSTEFTLTSIPLFVLLGEIRDLLARGLLRLRSRGAEEAARGAADRGARLLHFPATQRLHANRTTRRDA